MSGRLTKDMFNLAWVVWESARVMYQHPGTSPRRAHIVVVGILDLKIKNLEAALAPLRAHHAGQAAVGGAQHRPRPQALPSPHTRQAPARRRDARGCPRLWWVR